LLKQNCVQTKVFIELYGILFAVCIHWEPLHLPTERQMRLRLLIFGHFILDKAAKEIGKHIPTLHIHRTPNNLFPVGLHKPLKRGKMLVSRFQYKRDQIHASMNREEVLIVSLLFGVLEMEAPVFFVLLEGDHAFIETEWLP
jgi:hypothetical protein